MTASPPSGDVMLSPTHEGPRVAPRPLCLLASPSHLIPLPGPRPRPHPAQKLPDPRQETVDLILHKSRRWQGAGPTRALVKPTNELISALSQEHLRPSVQRQAVRCSVGAARYPCPEGRTEQRSQRQDRGWRALPELDVRTTDACLGSTHAGPGVRHRTAHTAQSTHLLTEYGRPGQARGDPWRQGHPSRPCSGLPPAPRGSPPWASCSQQLSNRTSESKGRSQPGPPRPPSLRQGSPQRAPPMPVQTLVRPASFLWGGYWSRSGPRASSNQLRGRGPGFHGPSTAECSPRP